MILLRTVLLVTLISCCFSGYAQPRKITAKVVDNTSRQPISYAEVKLENSGINNFSNFMGFFQLTAETDAQLTISHPGYLTSDIIVPANNTFLIPLERDYLDLGILEIDQVLEEPDAPDTAYQEVNPSFAQYGSGWNQFYKDLATAMKDHPLFAQLDSIFEVDIEFGITAKGSLEQLAITDSLLIGQVVNESLGGLGAWEPAKQNGFPVNQYFRISVTRGSEVFTVVDTQPTPVGGMVAYYEYINKNMRIPEEARQKMIEGKVFVNFVVDRQGKPTEIGIEKGIGAGYDEEAIRLIKEGPDWIPGSQRGKPVPVRMILPITFRLDGKNRVSTEGIFYQTVAQNIKYPNTARRMGLQGKVYAVFQIDKVSGKPKGVYVLNDFARGLMKEEVTRTLNVIDYDQIDFMQREKTYILPITFKLHDTTFENIPVELPEGLQLQEIIVTAQGISQASGSLGMKPDGSGGMQINREEDGRTGLIIKDSSPQSVEDALKRTGVVQRLSIVNKNLKRLDPRISELKYLLFVDLEGNLMEELPVEILKLKRLKELYVSKNRLLSLPDNFALLSSLKILALGYNQLSEFPQGVTGLQKLEQLDLSGNNIREVPPEIGQLKKLKLLVLNDNNIEKLPEEIFELNKLEKIFLKGNPISKEDIKQIRNKFSKTEVIF